MQVLFGPEHDHLHIDPKQPGAYEWWYFDALSGDGKYALVVIFFVGAPMSPYYKEVVDGKNPLPTDWCGVFFSLHERVPPSLVLSSGEGLNAGNRYEGATWREVAYTYNIYRDWNFKDAIHVRIGDSQLDGRFSHNGRRYTCTWKLIINEKNLWLGTTHAELEFETVGKFPEQEPIGEEDGHTWVCVAPTCRVQGQITPTLGKPISFSGVGYHDHNFGQLPWNADSRWLWGRGRIPLAGSQTRATVITYIHPDQKNQYLMVIDNNGKNIYQIMDAVYDPPVLPRRNEYGLTYAHSIKVIGSQAGLSLSVGFNPQQSLLKGPFYSRWVGDFSLTDGAGVTSKGRGILEVFDPTRLCHPLWSRLMWTRIRRRKLDSPIGWVPPPRITDNKRRGTAPHPLLSEAERGAIGIIRKPPLPKRKPPFPLREDKPQPPIPPANGEGS